MRQFISPSGRAWTARLFYFPGALNAASEHTSAPASHSVLRFESEGITLDLADWPSDWLDRSDEELVALVRAAQPPDYGIVTRPRSPRK